jgi:outer membrane protein assembly factor BamB
MQQSHKSLVFQVGSWQHGSPAVSADGTIYCTPCGYGRDQLLKAYSASGVERWAQTFPEVSLSRPAVGADGTVHLLAREGTAEESSSSLSAIKPDGSLKWRIERIGYAVISPFPVVDAGGSVYAVFGGSLHKVDRDGVVAWTSPAEGFDGGDLAIGLDSLFLMNGSGWQSRIQSFHLDGRLLWEYKAPFDAEEITRKERQRIAKKYGAERVARVLLHFVPPEFIGPPVVAPDGSVLVANRDGHLYSLNKNGSLNWRVSQQQPTATPEANASAPIAFVTSLGGLKAVTAEGNILWSLDGSFSTLPVVNQDGRIYVAQMHAASAYDVDGSLAWQQSIQGIPGRFPALMPDGAVCITTDWGFVHILL